MRQSRNVHGGLWRPLCMLGRAVRHRTLRFHAETIKGINNQQRQQPCSWQQRPGDTGEIEEEEGALSYRSACERPSGSIRRRAAAAGWKNVEVPRKSCAPPRLVARRTAFLIVQLLSRSLVPWFIADAGASDALGVLGWFLSHCFRVSSNSSSNSHCC